jgi:lysophospholipase L1-like esterase
MSEVHRMRPPPRGSAARHRDGACRLLAAAIALTSLLVARPSASEPSYLAEAVRNYGLLDRRETVVKHGVLFVGSSSIRLWPTERFFPNLHAVNRGISGSRIADVYKWFADLVLPYEPELIVFYSGENDISAGVSPVRVFMDYEAFVGLVHEHLPEAKIVFISIKPSLVRFFLWERMREANRLVETYSRLDSRLYYVDVAKEMFRPDGFLRAELFRPDGLHLNDIGYHLWSDIVSRVIEQAIMPHANPSAVDPSLLGPPRAPCGGS